LATASTGKNVAIVFAVLGTAAIATGSVIMIVRKKLQFRQLPQTDNPFPV
jgi:hypothetical protein